jgi:histidine triad (HIT) family protein
MKESISRGLFVLAKTPLGDLIVGLAFGRLSNLLPVKRIRETERVIVFWHPRPFWEKHILIVPKKRIRNIVEIGPEDMIYIDEVYRVAGEVIKELGWEKGGYSLLSNGGSRQEVNQLHFHLQSGEQTR